MKKVNTALCFSVLASSLAMTAHAQSSLTLFGTLDTGVAYTEYRLGNTLLLNHRVNTSATAKLRRTNAKTFGLADSIEYGNRWGLRGAEDLGGGLKTTFWLESGFSLVRGVTAQGGRLFGRQAWLALESDAWGQVSFGRQLNYGSRWVGPVALPWNDAFLSANQGFTYTVTDKVRLDNALMYTSPVFSGVQFGVGYAFHRDGAQRVDVPVAGGTNPKDNNVQVSTVGLRYNNGSFALAASYDYADLEKGNQPIASWVLAGRYDFGAVSVHLGGGQERNGVFNNRTTPITGLDPANPVNDGAYGQQAFVALKGYRADNYSVGLLFPLTANSRIAAAWQSARLGHSGAFKSMITSNQGDKAQNFYSVAYFYDFSMRTHLYANATYGDGIAFNDVRMARAVVGLNHKF